MLCYLIRTTSEYRVDVYSNFRPHDANIYSQRITCILWCMLTTCIIFIIALTTHNCSLIAGMGAVSPMRVSTPQCAADLFPGAAMTSRFYAAKRN